MTFGNVEQNMTGKKPKKKTDFVDLWVNAINTMGEQMREEKEDKKDNETNKYNQKSVTRVGQELSSIYDLNGGTVYCEGGFVHVTMPDKTTFKIDAVILKSESIDDFAVVTAIRVK